MRLYDLFLFAALSGNNCICIQPLCRLHTARILWGCSRAINLVRCNYVRLWSSVIFNKNFLRICSQDFKHICSCIFFVFPVQSYLLNYACVVISFHINRMRDIFKTIDGTLNDTIHDHRLLTKQITSVQQMLPFLILFTLPSSGNLLWCANNLMSSRLWWVKNIRVSNSRTAS